MDVEGLVGSIRGMEQEWLVVALAVGMVLAVALAWTGMQQVGEAADTRIDAPGPETGDEVNGEDNQTVESDRAGRLEVWAPGPLTCAGEMDRDAVQLRRTEDARDGMTRFLVNGTIRVPNPCQSLDATVVQEGGGYVLRITSSSSGTGFCTQCVASSSYVARLVVPADRLTVMHEGEVIDILTR